MNIKFLYFLHMLYILINIVELKYFYSIYLERYTGKIIAAHFNVYNFYFQQCPKQMNIFCFWNSFFSKIT